MRVRDLGLDAMRAAACIGVIVLHVAAIVVVNKDHVAHSAWVIGKAFDAPMRWCVPVFVMVTGALLLPGDGMSAGAFYRKRLPRVFLPLVFWTVAYWALRLVFMPNNIVFPDALWEVLDGSAFYHLWYLYMLVGLLFWIPILRAFDEKEGKNALLGAAGVTYLFGLVGIVTPLVFVTECKSTFFAASIPFSAYLVFGHLLWSRGKPLPVWLSVLAFVLSGVGVYAMTEVLLPYVEAPYDTTYSAFNPVVLLGATAVFGGFMTLARRPSTGVVAHVAGVSLGIYLLHPMLLFAVDRMLHNWLLANPAAGIPALALGVFAATWAICAVLERIPLLRPLVR
jgi:surface polysaccharide O-acyltransferase-like enzyme